VNAGGDGNGTTSNRKAPIKTSKYCHHIIIYLKYSVVFAKENSQGNPIA
jgi:hypothetical protein